MSQPVVIAGFASSNRVPGFYGDVEPGQGAQTAASTPLKFLFVGLPTTGSIVPDVQIQQILNISDCDTYFGAGSEGACMGYDALTVAGNAGVPVYGCTAKPAAGAVAATSFVKITGTATAAGSVIVRIGGKPISVGVSPNDTGAQVCTNLAGVINGYNGGRLPISASAGTNYCTLSCRTAGQRGMQHVVFLDTTQLPAGLVATLYTVWTTNGGLGQAYLVGDCVIPKAAPNGLYFKCTTAGTGSTTTEPTWPTTVGTTVVDGTVTWTCWGSTATGNAPTTALFLGNGSGLETYTNLLGTLASANYDRIALAANDATSLAAWKTQIDQYMAAPYNFLQHVMVAANGTLAAATSLYQTTLNDTSFEGLWLLNAETHPSRIAAAFMAYRAMIEQTNPNPNYDGLVLSTVAPQSQVADWPALPTLISAINNSVTPLGSQNGDGQSHVVRAITTKSLTGGSADYSTLDTGQRTVPDFVFKDAKVYYLTYIQPGNPVCQDDPPPGQRQPISGIMTPSRVASLLAAKLVDYSLGIISGTSQSVVPFVLNPLPGDVTGTWDPVAQRPMIAENVRVMPLFHQLGVSVRQVVS